jgi:hypothetical protein
MYMVWNVDKCTITFKFVIITGLMKYFSIFQFPLGNIIKLTCANFQWHILSWSETICYTVHYNINYYTRYICLFEGNKQTPCLLVHKQTIPTSRLPKVGEINANFCITKYKENYRVKDDKMNKTYTSLGWRERDHWEDLDVGERILLKWA